MLSGHCLCKAVRVRIAGPSRAPGACHCSQCRRQSGHYWASVEVEDSDLFVTGDVRWYVSSPGVRRGFCPTCGSFLFWKADAETNTGVSMGILNPPTGLRLGRHIFTADKGDYYDIADNVPQEEQENG